MGWPNPEQYGALKGKHTKGLAFDVEIWNDSLIGVWPCADGDRLAFWASGNGGVYNPSDPRWYGETGIGAIGKSVGLKWGGDWAAPDTDIPHFYID